jgi:hypothetical protein
LAEGSIHVQRQLSVAKGKGRDGSREARPAKLVPLKTEAGERFVLVVPELVVVLRSHKAARFELGHAGASDFVFGTEEGRPLIQRTHRGRCVLRASGRRT